MSIAGLIIVIIAGIIDFFAFKPQLGRLSWISVPVAITGFCLSLSGVIGDENKVTGIIGLIIGLLVTIIGAVRLCQLFIAKLK